MKLKTVLTSSILLALSLALAWATIAGPLRSSEAVLNDFLMSEDRAEDQLTDPLVLASSRVRPVVLDAIKNKDMKRRRYAIGFLGCSRYTAAAPVFRQILGDESEEDYFRSDALEGLWLINPDEGVGLAKGLAGRSDFLGQVARELVAGSWKPYCRTWTDAFIGRHD